MDELSVLTIGRGEAYASYLGFLLTVGRSENEDYTRKKEG